MDIKFRNELGEYCVVSFPVRNNEGKTFILRTWVEYDRGYPVECWDFDRVRRGYYLYISLEEITGMGVAFTESDYNRKIYLGGVKRKSVRSYEEHVKKAEMYVYELLGQFCRGLDVDWSGKFVSRWSGDGNRLGLYRIYYHVEYVKNYKCIY